jgi:hypothetical protein
MFHFSERGSPEKSAYEAAEINRRFGGATVRAPKTMDEPSAAAQNASKHDQPERPESVGKSVSRESG